MKKPEYQRGFDDAMDLVLGHMAKYRAGYYIIELMIRDIIKMKNKQSKK